MFVYDSAGQLVAEYSTALATVQQVSYLTTDHLGSPRITTDQNGKVTNRKDFTAYGEEVISSQRTAGLNGNGYEPSSPTRKDYTGYEKDQESGLEFAQARYYNASHGRFTSVDPLTASASIKNPQTFNRYSYVLNSPYKFSDPLGLIPQTTGANGGRSWCSTCQTDDNDNGGFADPPPPPRQQPKPPTPPPTTDQNAAPPQIAVEGVSVITRTAKRSKSGDFLIVNGERVYEETVLSVGLKPQDFSPVDFEVNLNSGEGLLNISETLYLKTDLALVGSTDSAEFEDNATFTPGSVTNISKKTQTDTEISGDGKRMSIYSSLFVGEEGVGRGKIGTVTISVRASYVDGYDSSTNKILVPKTISRDVRIALTNTPPAPNLLLKKPF